MSMKKAGKTILFKNNFYFAPLSMSIKLHCSGISPLELKKAAYVISQRCYPCFFAEVTVFFKSIAIVIGPTPPGTGVI